MTYLGKPNQKVVDWLKSRQQPSYTTLYYSIEGSSFSSIFLGSTLTYSDIGKYDPTSSDNTLVQIAGGTNCTTIDADAVASCVSLTAVSFPSCMIVSSYAFDGCTNLKTVSFPACTIIGQDAFAYCSKLTTVSFPACMYIGTQTFTHCQLLETAYFQACTLVGYRAFSVCSSLKIVNFPVCMTIENSAFEQCASLLAVSFPACTTVGEYAFFDCSKLTTASFPACQTIGNSAFGYCYNLKSLYLTGSSVCSLAASSAFNLTPIAGYTESTGGILGSIYVQSALVDSYKAASNWSYFAERFVGI